MNCSEWEERVALYAGGDVCAGVESHLAECAGCQLLLSGLRQSMALVREAHGEPVDAAHFAAVRARVFAELERSRARRWRSAWVFAMAAAAMVLLVATWPRPEVRMALPIPPAPSAPLVAKVVEKTPALIRHQAVRPSETFVMKIETDNPDVVLYWIAETKGETK
jgi:hypothetical protein